METIIFATKNKGKIKEINEILADMDVNVISMEEAGITIDVVEDGKTFEENAMKKAVQVMEIGGKITLSDDSGLEIDYMDKAPGIYSARFMGEDTPYPERFKAIFEKLNGVPEEKRTARFVSCIAAAFPDGRRLVSYDTVEGIIGYEAKGENGKPMKILALSDTHAYLENARAVLARLQGKVDAVFHLGDHDDDAVALQQEFPKLPFHYVKGNNDYRVDTPSQKLVRLGGKTCS